MTESDSRAILQELYEIKHLNGTEARAYWKELCEQYGIDIPFPEIVKPLDKRQFRADLAAGETIDSAMQRDM